jgi:hypothetical protein
MFVLKIILKIPLSRTAQIISNKLGTNHSWVVQVKGLVLFKGEKVTKIEKGL